MNIKAVQRQPVAELAQQERRLEATLKPEWFARLSTIDGGVSAVSCDVRFALDGHRRPTLSGTASAHLALACQRCESNVERHIDIAFAVTLLSEGQASRAQFEEGAVDLRIIEDGRVDIVELLEDELLLGIPAQVCIDTSCENAPVMTFPAPEAEIELEEPPENPFAVLAKLKSQPTQSD